MNTQLNNEQKTILSNLAHIVRETLPQSAPHMAIDVTAAGQQVLAGTAVFIDADVYSMVIGEVEKHGSELKEPVYRAKLLDLLCAARPLMNNDHCGYFEHWLIARNSVSKTPVLYRFSVFESSRHAGAWLITQSSI